jgi:hypothetical protein
MKRLRIAAFAIGLAALIVCMAIAGLQAGPPQQVRPSVPVASPAPAAPSERQRVEGRPVAAAMPSSDANEAIKTYCVGCHNERLRRGELSLASFDIARISEHAEAGEKIVRKLRLGMMPPKEASRKPDAATRLALVSALETGLDAAGAKVNPGRRAFQRLNRAEYAAAIRALFGLDVDVSHFLPADTISASFDNIADVQMPSATVMQGYLRAAAHVSRIAVGDTSTDASSTQYEVPRTQSQKGRVEGAPFGTRGGTSVVHNFPADGKYKFQMLLHGEPTGMLFGRTVRDVQMEVAIDGERVALLKVDRWISEADPEGLTVSTPLVDVRAGPRRVAATFIQEFEGSEDDLIKPIDHTLADTQIGVGYGVTTLPHLRNLGIVGPFEVTGVSDNPTRRAIFTCRPTAPEEAVPCARRIIERLATLAYRGPASASDVDELMRFYNEGAKSGGFEGGVRTALQAMLSSLHFVFRIEDTSRRSATGAKADATYAINDVDLASRLSFFLWGTIPDTELIDTARRGILSRREIFDRQVRRMLTDPRSDALGSRFASQWLRLQDLDKVEPDALSFPYFDVYL